MKKFIDAACLTIEAIIFGGMFGLLFTLAFDRFMEPVIHAGVAEQSVLVVGATLFTMCYTPLALFVIKGVLDDCE